MKLTKRLVDSAKYDGTNLFSSYWDDGLSGFGLRVFPSGKKSFVLKYRIKNRQRVVTIGRYGAMTVEQARQRAAQLRTQVYDNIDPQSEKELNRRHRTVKELADEYLKRHAKPHKKSWRDDESRLRRHVIPALGSLAIDAITRMDIAELHSRLGKNHPYEANRTLKLLSKMFELAIDWGYLQESHANPARRIKTFREIKRDRWVTPAEMPRLATALNEVENPYIRTLLWLYLLTGARKTELLKVKWDQVDFEQNVVRLPDTKSGQIAYIPLSTPAIQLLKNLPRELDNPYVFPGRVAGNPLNNISKAWKNARSSANLLDVRLHDLRRTVGSWMASSGVSLHLIQGVLNQTTDSATRTYAHLSDLSKRKAIDQHANQLAPFLN